MLANNRVKIVIAVFVGIFILLSMIAIVGRKASNELGIETAVVSSPFTHTSKEVTPYYKADYASGDEDAVNTVYSVFDIDNLKVSDDIKNALRYGVQPYLNKYQTPSVEVVFIHLDVETVIYKNTNDFSFNFYSDSPEGYFSYTASPTGDDKSYVTIKPIAGGWL
ncbi:MAG: hypothetical protein WBP12_04215 [Candidatus Saccharimonas sp.]